MLNVAAWLSESVPRAGAVAVGRGKGSATAAGRRGGESWGMEIEALFVCVVGRGGVGSRFAGCFAGGWVSARRSSARGAVTGLRRGAALWTGVVVAAGSSQQPESPRCWRIGLPAGVGASRSEGSDGLAESPLVLLLLLPVLLPVPLLLGLLLLLPVTLLLLVSLVLLPVALLLLVSLITMELCGGVC
jgi:hypothetical protein